MLEAKHFHNHEKNVSKKQQEVVGEMWLEAEKTQMMNGEEELLLRLLGMF